MAYFTVEVKPLVPASTQNAAAFTAGDLLFDWKEFEIPRGGAKLVGVTAIVRPKGDAGPTPNNFGIDLIFGKVGTSLGDVNAVFGLTTPQDDFLGSVNIAQSNFVGPDSAVSTSCTSVGSVSNIDMMISPNVTALNTGTNVGYDKFYVAGIANGAIDFRSVIANTETAAAEAAASKIITTDGSCSPIELFLPGDVIHIGTSEGSPAADSLYGTLLTADLATQITLEAVSATALVDGDVLYNINPIKLLLHFEK